jgi:hypothetical protein
MPTEPKKPLIVISYAHEDEPEDPAEGEVKWLSFVASYLRPAIKHGAVDLWLDRLMPGGADWEREIEQKLRACDVFILLVSRHSLSSDYVVDKEIAIIRERQAKGEDVHFYPLILTPTPKIALDLVRDRNLRPRDGKPFSNYSLNERYRHMADAADEITATARRIVAGKWRIPQPIRSATSAASHSMVGAETYEKSPTSRPAPITPPPERSLTSTPSAAVPRTSPPKTGGRRSTLKSTINDRHSLEFWLWRQSRRVAIVIGVRAALRVAPKAFLSPPERRWSKDMTEFLELNAAIFRANALARVATKYPPRAKELDNFGANRAAAVAFSAARAAASRDVHSDGPNFTSSANAAGAAFAAVRAARVDGSDTAPAEGAASAAFAAARVANDEIWDSIRADIVALRKVNVATLIDSPLWLREVPDWVRDDWATLQSNLPRDQDWDVWIDWYEDRLRGVSKEEANELVFATVPRDVSDRGPAIANASIKDRLRRILTVADATNAADRDE